MKKMNPNSRNRSASTNSKTDELFELCKRVYEATGWDTGEGVKWYFPDGYVWLNSKILNHVKPIFPLYNSDYLLEKLPSLFGRYSLSIYYFHAEDYWCATYGGTRGIKGIPMKRSRKSPLLALLKLTLALHEQGLLTPDNKGKEGDK